jgi:LPS sulfotransferase NodH
VEQIDSVARPPTTDLQLDQVRIKATPAQRLLMTSQEVARRMRRVGIRVSNKSYRPFVLIGRSRTGSTLLMRSLKDHPAVVGYGELFRDDRINWQVQLGMPTATEREQYSTNPSLLLRERVFGAYGPRVQAVGFKLFYYHAQQPDWQQVWQTLAAQPSVHVIHVKRRNLLATHLSRKVAGMTSRWNGKVANGGSRGPLTLDYAECRQDFEQTRQWEMACDQRFANHPLLQVTYEDLATDFTGELSRVQTFLALPTHPMQPATAKQEQKELAQRIANYSELKAQFAGTVWADFFE